MKPIQVSSYSYNEIPNTLVTTLEPHGLEGLVEVRYNGKTAYGVGLGCHFILQGEHHVGGIIYAKEIQQLPQGGSN